METIVAGQSPNTRTISLNDAKNILNRVAGTPGRLVAHHHHRDADGAPIDDGSLASILTGSADDISAMGLNDLRVECWRQYSISPFVQSSVNDAVGALCGDGFSVSSPDARIRDLVKRETNDYRNELYTRLSQYVTHKKVSGELFLSLSCHDRGDSFVEVDFLDPSRIKGIGQDDCGIIFHPRKTRMPILYSFEQEDGTYTIIPSIYVAYNPSLINDIKPQLRKEGKVDLRNARGNKARPGALSSRFERIGGFKRFVVEWEGPVLSRRYGSYLRSVLIWWNLYSLMKFTEVDHKRAMASFCYVATPRDQPAWDLWESLTPEQKEMTGLLSPKPPGSTLLTPPGWEVKAISPQLPTLSGNDYDLQELLVGGLNLPNDVVTGTSQGRTFGSVKESRGPWGDRIRQDQHNFRTWYIHNFWKPITFLYATLYNLQNEFVARECIAYDRGQPIFGDVKKEAWELITVSLPVFSAGNMDATVRAWLGAKSASLDDKLGLSKGTIAKKLGIYDYDGERRASATENETYPELKPPAEDEAGQEAWIEPPQEENTGGED